MMRTKILTLGLICLFVLIPGCKKQLPTSPDISSIIHPKIEYFTASHTQILLGESSTLSWSVKNATTITIDQGIGAVAEQGTIEVSPEEATTYTLVASTGNDSARASVQVDVLMPATFDFRANLDLTCPPSPYNTEGWVSSQGWVQNIGGQPGTNVVIHVPLIDEITGDEFHHLERLVSSRVEPGEIARFEFTWTVPWEIYIRIAHVATHDAIYFTWDNN